MTTLPLMVVRVSEVKLLIVGRDTPPEIAGLASPQAITADYGPDVIPCFEQNAVFVAPLRHGAGMKRKIGQGLRVGLPVVTTSVGAEGIGLRNGGSAFVRDDLQEFATAVVDRQTSPDTGHRLSVTERALIDGRFSQRRVAREVLSLV